MTCEVVNRAGEKFHTTRANHEYRVDARKGLVGPTNAYGEVVVSDYADEAVITTTSILYGLVNVDAHTAGSCMTLRNEPDTIAVVDKDAYKGQGNEGVVGIIHYTPNSPSAPSSTVVPFRKRHR